MRGRHWVCCEVVAGCILGTAAGAGGSELFTAMFGGRSGSVGGWTETEAAVSLTRLISASGGVWGGTSPSLALRAAGRSLADVGLVLGPGWGP